jgi:putative phosphoribosyl transferase
MTPYRDRVDAGDALASALAGYRNRPDAIVLGLVRGGVPVAARVAAALNLPMDALVVRKLGVPWSPEVAFGALGPGGVRVLHPDVIDRLDQADIDEVTAREGAELSRRESQYRSGRPPLRLDHRTAIIIDDGLATGATAMAAVAVARQFAAERVVLAAPVGSIEAVRWLSGPADEVICPWTPSDFDSVSRFYHDFPQVTDDEVGDLLASRP